jgi:hypothetical protein
MPSPSLKLTRYGMPGFHLRAQDQRRPYGTTMKDTR